MRESSREELFYIEQIAALSTDGASDAEIGEALENPTSARPAPRPSLRRQVLGARGPPSARGPDGAQEVVLSAESPLEFRRPKARILRVRSLVGVSGSSSP